MAWAVFINNTCSDTLEPFHPLVHFPFHNSILLIFLILLWVMEGSTPSDHKNQMSTHFWTELIYLHYDCMSFTEHNGYPMIYLNLACSTHDVSKSTVWQIIRILHANFPYFLNSLCNLYSWLYTIRVNKSSRISWVEYLAHMGEMRYGYIIWREEITWDS